MVGVDQVLEKLATVIDPDLKKDIVSMGMIKDLELNCGDMCINEPQPKEMTFRFFVSRACSCEKIIKK